MKLPNLMWFLFFSLNGAFLACKAANLTCQTGYEAHIQFSYDTLESNECGSNQICIKAETNLNYSLVSFGRTISGKSKVVLSSCADAHLCSSLTCTDLFRKSGLKNDSSGILDSLEISSASECNITSCSSDFCNLDDFAVIVSKKGHEPCFTNTNRASSTQSSTNGNIITSPNAVTYNISSSTPTPTPIQKVPSTTSGTSFSCRATFASSVWSLAIFWWIL